MDTGRHRVTNFAMDTLNPINLFEKLNDVFDGLKGATELNVAFSIVLKNGEDGNCRY